MHDTLQRFLSNLQLRIRKAQSAFFSTLVTFLSYERPLLIAVSSSPTRGTSVAAHRKSEDSLLFSAVLSVAVPRVACQRPFTARRIPRSIYGGLSLGSTIPLKKPSCFLVRMAQSAFTASLSNSSSGARQENW